MNFEDEQYVRLFTRDTATWVSMCWEARALLPLIMRKLDRTGCLDLDSDVDRAVEVLAELVRMPRHVVRDGLLDLLRTKTLVTRGVTFVMPKFSEAQSFTKSDAERARAYRERKRREKLAESDSSDHTLERLTNGSTTPTVTNVTNVTCPVTPSRSVLPVTPVTNQPARAHAHTPARTREEQASDQLDEEERAMLEAADRSARERMGQPTPTLSATATPTTIFDEARENLEEGKSSDVD